MEDIVVIGISRMKFLFPPPNNFSDYWKIQLTLEGSRSVTPHKIADEICVRLRRYKSDIRTVVDATANVGGNAIAFGKAFPNVIAFEIKTKTAQILQNNLSVYGLTNVNVVNHDFNSEIPVVAGLSDVIFIDPPWFVDGKENVTLSLNYCSTAYQLPIEETICRIWHNSPDVIVVVKVPKNKKLLITETDVMQFAKMDILVLMHPSKKYCNHICPNRLARSTKSVD